MENWSFAFAALCMAVDPRVDELMRQASQVEAEAYNHADLDEEAQRIIANLYYISILTCKDKAQGNAKSAPWGEGLEAGRLLCVEFEPKVPSRFPGMLNAIHYPTLPEADPIKGIVSWEALVQRSEEQTGEHAMESIEKLVLSARLVPNKLRERLMLNATRFTTHDLVRAEAINYPRAKQATIVAQTASSGPAPMGLDRLMFGKNGGTYKDGKTGGGNTDGKTRKTGGGKRYDDRPCKYCNKKGPNLMERRKAGQD